MWYERNISQSIQLALASRPALVLTGARQTGKSSLLRRLCPRATYVTFDDPALAAYATSNPSGFLDSLPNEQAVILDEIQYVPELPRYLKMRIDQERERYGRWILTGSQRFDLMRGIAESLAGRVAVFELYSLSPSEIIAGRSDAARFPLRGGYPELWTTPLDVSEFFGSYVRTFIERDLRSVIDVSSVRDLDRMLRAVATRSAQLVNFSAFASELGVSGPTGKAWAQALIATNIAALVEPWYGNLSKRLIKTPKIYIVDPGMMSHLLNIKDEEHLSRHPMRGAHWESVVHATLIRDQALMRHGRPLFYRDKAMREVDFIIDCGSQILAIEAKAAEQVVAPSQNHRDIAAVVANGRPVQLIMAAPFTFDQPRLLGDFWAWNPLRHSELSTVFA